MSKLKGKIMPIKPGPIVQNFIQTQFKLSEQSSINDNSLGQVMRLFDLKEGESVSLKGVEGDDYIFISTGKVIIEEAGKTHYIQSNRQNPSPFLIPEDSNIITIKAEKNCLFYHIDSEKLDFILAWDELGSFLDTSDRVLKDRMDTIMNSLPFSQLGIGNVKEALGRMHEVKVKAGDNIINESDSAKAYFVIAEGSAEIWQTTEEEDPILIATLNKGDGFGEEGVVTGTHVNTVKMISDGLLYALDKSDFDDLMSCKMIETQNSIISKALLDDGYKMLDVRYEFELEIYGSIQPSTHIPLHELRERYTEVNPDEKYVVYCKSGNRSQVACLLLEQRGIEAISLDGGINGWPYEKVEAGF